MIMKKKWQTVKTTVSSLPFPSFTHDFEDDFVDYDSDLEVPTEPVTRTDVDPYAGTSHIPINNSINLTILGIFYSKDRQEEVIEVEEDPETELIPELHERFKLMTQGQWMKGCPEGGEQSFLFALYSELSDGKCSCPQGCDFFVTRKKSDFFPILVRPTSSPVLPKLTLSFSPTFHHIPIVWPVSPERPVQIVILFSVWLVANLSLPIKSKDRQPPQMTIPSSIVQISKASFLVSVWP